MTVLTLPSVQAQNNFGRLLDSAQRGMVSITRRGRPVALVLSPEVLQDYLDGYLALQAEEEGMFGLEESNIILNQYRHA